MPTHPFPPGPLNWTRRQFVTGAAGAGLLGLTDLAAASAPELAGQQFDLNIGYKPVNLTGRDRQAVTVNNSLPAPTLRWREGDTVTLNVGNALAEDTSIHWHGIILPTGMDGVPGLSFAGIRPGEVFRYQFKLHQTGTYWYHSHSGFQEQKGVYGGIIIEPKGADPDPVDRDYVVILSDWTDDDPGRIQRRLKKSSEYYQTNPRTVGDLAGEIRASGMRATLADRAMWNSMRMSDRDLSDVTGATYTFLMNGKPPERGWTGLFRKGERVRLRFINAAAMTLFDVRIPGLPMTVVEHDGQAVERVTVDEFRLGVAETCDVIVSPEDDAYCVFAQALDRSGFAGGRLVTDPSLQPEIPAVDPQPTLSHSDMGMAMSGMHGHHGHHGHHGNHGSAEPQRGAPGLGSAAPIVHTDAMRGPHVDMLAEEPRYRLDDPGVGLRDNGRRVLTYADLRNRYPTIDQRDPTREIQLHLTGNMARYMWSLDGIPFADADPIQLALNERVRITLVNNTMMNHPIHLHGMWSELETGDGEFLPRKHTVVVQPGSLLSYLVTPDEPGRWAYHCHLLFHMAGMFREVRVS